MRIEEPEFYFGLDLGQAADFTALAVLQRQRIEPRGLDPEAEKRNGVPKDLGRIDGLIQQVFRAPMDGSLQAKQAALLEGLSAAVGRWEGLLDAQELHEERGKAAVEMMTRALKALPYREPEANASYLLRHLQRFPLGTSYPVIVEQVIDLLRRPETRGRAVLLVDATGVGRPVVDLFRRAKVPARLIGITITAGQAESGDWHVPKKDLIGAAQVLLQARRLRIRQEMDDAAVLVEELLSFQMKVTDSARETFEARAGQHDDLVLAVAMAAWYAERHRPRRRESFRGRVYGYV